LVKKRYLAITAVIGVAITYLLICGFSFIKTGFGLFDSHENEYGKFVRVGDMHYARSGHKAVLLQDGRVLIVGGASEPVAEIYDPEKRKFYKTGSMNINRDNFTATLLQNGKVLIAGGQRGNTPLNDVELYNPNTKSFEKAPELNFSRHSHTATLLSDGRVLIVGGQGPSGKKTHTWAVKKSEIYNPKTDTFEIGPEMNIPRVMPESIALNNGNVLIIGGGDSSKNKDAEYIPEIYFLPENKFVKLDKISFVVGYGDPSPILLKNGKVLLPFCKKNAKRMNFQIFDPDFLSFNDTGVSIDRNFKNNVSVLLENGNVLFFGGTKELTWWYDGIKNTFLYDINTNSLIESTDLKYARAFSTATLLNDGTVLITGGKGKTSKLIKKSELYIPIEKN